MFLEMKIAGITLDPSSNMPIIILKDLNGDNALPIWIGIAEASAIATKLENIDLARPMTHDLLRNILAKLEVKLEKIEVTDLRDNTFYANIYLKVGNQVVPVDSRPSDAIALALRTDSPIFVDEEVIKKSRRSDLKVDKAEEGSEGQKDRWTEILESLSPDAFGKYKM
ncbi:MAG: bifunctional nuclease family protein [bacterium]